MSGRAMTLEEFTNVLVASEIVPSEAVDDADGYDDGDTVYHIRTAYADIFDEPCARTKAVDARNDGGPAFPRSHASDGHNGMTLRQYAAIKLRVPASGTDWLDAAIRAAMRDEFACQALCIGWNDAVADNDASDEYVVRRAYEIADAMLAEREREAQS